MALLTYEAAVASYLENADFAETQSLAKARAFESACVALAVLLPSSASDQGSSQTFDQREIQANKYRAQSFIAANASRVRYLSTNTGDFR